MYCDEALLDICHRHLGIESPTLVILDSLLAKIFSSLMAALRLHRTLKVTIPAPNISSLAASPRTCEQPVRRRGPAQHLLHEPPRREDHDEHLRAGGDSRDEQPALQQEDAEPERQFEDSELRRLGFLSPADWRP